MRQLLVFPLLFLIALSSQAQTLPDAINAPQAYQLYLNESLQSIEQVHYNDEMRTPLRFELDADKTTLHLPDYHKRGSVTIIGTDAQGNAVEIRRSSCFIDPVMPT